MKHHISGIYQIKCKTNNKIYIGSSVNIKQRWKYHKWQLRAGKHDAKYMQNCRNKYGEEDFVFSILLICDPNNVLFYEQRFIDTYKVCDNKYGFNSCPVAGSALGRKLSEETKKTLSRSLRDARKKYEWKGQQLCLSDIAEMEDVSVTTLMYRVLGMGYDIKRAVEQEKRLSKYILEYKGEVGSIQEWADKLGIHPRRLNYWIKEGLTIEECISRSKSKDISLREFCKVFGISDTTVKSRLKRGISLLDAFYEPSDTNRNEINKAIIYV